MKDIRILLNGKKAGLDNIRKAIFAARESGVVEVRTTWEGGDVKRLVKEALVEGCQRLVAAGGDGTVNEVVDVLLDYPIENRPELAILPLGTANDFATGCMIPSNPIEALSLAQTGTSYSVDSVKANQYHFINVASGGFGAQVTANTPVALKNFLGGGAYTISGLIQALNFNSFLGELHLPGESIKHNVIAGAACNGRQAGGGVQLAPSAMIDDGLIDLISINRFSPENIPQVIKELQEVNISGNFVKRYKVPHAEWARIPPHCRPVGLRRFEGRGQAWVGSSNGGPGVSGSVHMVRTK